MVGQLNAVVTGPGAPVVLVPCPGRGDAQQRHECLAQYLGPRAERGGPKLR